MKEKQLFEELSKQSTVNINGDITEAKNAKISIFDRGFLYGDSIYEVTYSDNSSLIFLNEHIDRLFHSANLLEMKLFFTREFIIEQVLKTVKYSKLKNAYIRIIVTRGETAITLDPNSSFKNNLIIIVRPKSVHPQILYTNGISLFIPNIIRNDIKSINPNAKSGNYLNNVLAISEAKKYGADDAVMVNHYGEVTEGTTFNIWMVKDGVLYTPPLSSGLLKGITREKVLEICHTNNLPIKVKAFSKEFLISADEIFITSSTRGVMPVAKINATTLGIDIKNWPITNRLINLYKEILTVEMKEKKYHYE